MSEVSKKFKVGDKVKVVSLQSDIYRGDCEVGIRDTGVITDVDEYSVLKYYVESDEGYSWWWEERNLELVDEEGDEDVVKQDNVNHPNHYRTGKTECIVAMEDMLSPKEFIGYLRGNIFKYTYRYKDKNGIEDLKKAQWYLNKLIEKEAEKQALEKVTNHG